MEAVYLSDRMKTMARTQVQKYQRNRTFVFLVSTLALLIFNMQPLFAQDDPNEADKPDKLFSSEETINMTLTGPWREIEKNKDFQEPYEGKLEYTDDQGNPISLDLTVQRRGITRQRVCDFPPIRLRFEKEEVNNTTFRGQDSLKMVTHCNKAEKYEQYYILEMLAYRMYNLITDFSFRVRPLNVTYLDSDTGTKIENRFAFLIEDDSDVAKRHDLKKVRIGKIGISKLQPRQTSEMSLFAYMISNLDWSAMAGPDDSCCHNSKLIGPEPLLKEDKVYPIPYDFDASGLVNAPYAAPPAGVPVKNVTQRLYRGICRFNDELEATRQEFLKQETAIFALISNEKRLYENTQKKSIKFIENFFKIIKDPKAFEKNIIRDCRK
jgi:hypothetical protein